MLGTSIKKLRESRNMTLSQLSKKTDISKSYLSNIERNIQENPSIGILLKIAIALEVDLQRFLESNNSSDISTKTDIELTQNVTIDIMNKMLEQNKKNFQILEEIKNLIESSR
ncbi:MULTISPECIES: helix-turn-helix domain-containing protein [Bacillaceae]|uniref:helix-turn-helix domain-containing protein n=1 Tax=Bacillaceae TaxID=186817 RepID=UPI000BFB38A4|nr:MULTISPECIES: helix-turn-helix transcriptional regulator [Bacillaceae]PGT82979.1 transcriptional regulator [Bacillus sp. AFS040349]UGB29473.1 helix-turn-helix domain-containing protein [Metabacillus sp. B2-18]